ncbi:MAG: Dynamin family protein [Leptolyngbya sp. DLM2.Bin15]|nr:MAG: Dynamin family protein [Leptolyngbya sp. DLM2.Bin15]
MDWKTASSYYEAQLSEALMVCRYAIDLAMLPQAGVPARLREKLEAEEKPAQRQLERLRKREFRIAVVGLEKAGKSTFINAWLECDLLPAKAARCTFTTTQIYSVAEESSQRLEVQVKTDHQFSQLKEDLKARGASEDLETIEKHEDALNKVRRNGNSSHSFLRLEDIKHQLRTYVADEEYAYAVQEARLYTSKLAQAEGIVFYDVPGLDSGLAKHVEEAEQMLSDCDAVILVQRFTSLREKELDIIKYTGAGDKNVTVADKLFVFLSRIDAQASPEALQQHIKEATEDWVKRTKLSSQRIVSGSAGAYLVLNGLADQQTQLEIGTASDLANRIKRLTGIEDEEALKQQGTGIPEIKARIFDYINTERVSVLQRRCDAFLKTILETAEEICTLVRKTHPENVEDAKQAEEERRRIRFQEWWYGQKWEDIQADLQMFCEQLGIAPDTQTWVESLVESSTSSHKFKERYLQLVESSFQDLKERVLADKDKIFAANSNPVFDSANANYRWRERVYPEVTKTLLLLANELAIELQDEAMKLVDYMTGLLWGSSQVKASLIEDSDQYFLVKLENSLSVLFLRFARPVAEALIRGPVNSETREKIVRALGVDIELVDNYYSGEEPAFQILKRYVKYGSALLFDADLRQEILGVIDHPSDNPDSCESSSVTLRSPQAYVVFEVKNDINAFEQYLRHAIFDAAGFEAYCTQELKSLVDSFRDKGGTWAGIAMNEWLQENPRLLAELPSDLRPRELNVEVSDRLRQLATALRTVDRNRYDGIRR